MTGTKITLQIGDTISSWETDSDELCVNDILDGFYGLLISHTFIPSSITSSMREFADTQEDCFKPIEN